MELLKRTYQVQQYAIDVFFTPGTWNIPNTADLAALMENDPQSFYALYELLQSEHQHLFGRKMNIERESFVVELWAHLFVEKFLRIGRKYARFDSFEKLIDQVLKRTAMIDCGEEDNDHNRKLWDLLAKVFNPVKEDMH